MKFIKNFVPWDISYKGYIDQMKPICILRKVWQYIQFFNIVWRHIPDLWLTEYHSELSFLIKMAFTDKSRSLFDTICWYRGSFIANMEWVPFKTLFWNTMEKWTISFTSGVSLFRRFFYVTLSQRQQMQKAYKNR